MVPTGRKLPAALPVMVFGLGLFVLWAAATWLLEGRLLTLQRPEAQGARLLYAVVANLLVGTVLACVVLGRFVGSGVVSLRQLGFRSVGHTILAVGVGLLLGLLVLLVQRPPTGDLIVLANGYAQTLVVSIAEVLVCWAVVGSAALFTMGADRRSLAIPAAVSLCATLFGLYHFAHSPPFDTVRMVALLTVVGLATGTFYFSVREIYGTIVFHNFLALTGVTQALADSGRLADYATPQWPLLLTAVGAVLILRAVDSLVRRCRYASVVG